MENENISETGTAHNEPHFSEETLASLRDLGEVIRKIHNRLVSEGYVIANGKILKPGEKSKSDAGEPR